MIEMALQPGTISNAESMIEKLKTVESMETAPQEFVLGVLQRGFNPSEHASV